MVVCLVVLSRNCLDRLNALKLPLLYNALVLCPYIGLFFFVGRSLDLCGVRNVADVLYAIRAPVTEGGVSRTMIDGDWSAADSSSHPSLS